MNAETFWWGMTMFCVAWYSTITIYVSVRSVIDIRSMLNNLARRENAPDAEGPEASMGREPGA